MRRLPTTHPDVASDFKKFAQERSTPGSNMPGSYVQAINKLNVILKQNTSLLAKNEDLWTFMDTSRLREIYEAILKAQKTSGGGFFAGTPTPSYWKQYFYSSAIKMLMMFLPLHSRQELMLAKAAQATDAVLLAKELDAVELPTEQIYWDDDVPVTSAVGRDRLETIKVRENQNVFRQMMLKNYHRQCCLCGLPVVETLRASHISGWAEDKANRLNPTNGLCLAATYDAAFDKHLISLDEDYRLILSPSLHEYYTNKAFQEQFNALEGRKITMPSRFLPSQEFLAGHRERMSKTS